MIKSGKYVFYGYKFENIDFSKIPAVDLDSLEFMNCDFYGNRISIHEIQRLRAHFTKSKFHPVGKSQEKVTFDGHEPTTEEEGEADHELESEEDQPEGEEKVTYEGSGSTTEEESQLDHTDEGSVFYSMEAHKALDNEKLQRLNGAIFALEHYRNYYLKGSDEASKQKCKAVNSFLDETKKLLTSYKNGDTDAFHNYKDEISNKINDLKSHRTVWPYIKSAVAIVATVLTGILPGLIALEYQRRKTNSNSLLFFNEKTNTEKMADNVVDFVQDLGK
jgi:hypothetical protein